MTPRRITVAAATTPGAILLTVVLAFAATAAPTASPIYACPLPSTGTDPTADTPDPGCDATPADTDWIAPVTAPIGSGFRTADRPHHNGVDLLAARGTVIRAASSGVVSVVRCNTTPVSWGCDRDGGEQILGCGWYVDITHPGNPVVVTRYCHMQSQPIVVEGQQVAAGQPLGRVGSSGNSTGPHLHFEVHLGGHDSGSAVSPVGFMIDHGAPLG